MISNKVVSEYQGGHKGVLYFFRSNKIERTLHCLTIAVPLPDYLLLIVDPLQWTESICILSTQWKLQNSGTF